MLIRLSDIDGGASPNIFYDLGLVVTHHNYGYRGVIVAVDPVCMAGDTWYKTNKTQPNRDQPWYHVLVHDSGGLSTYVAHSNLPVAPRTRTLHIATDCTRSPTSGLNLREHLQDKKKMPRKPSNK